MARESCTQLPTGRHTKRLEHLREPGRHARPGLDKDRHTLCKDLAGTGGRITEELAHLPARAAPGSLRTAHQLPRGCSGYGYAWRDGNRAGSESCFWSRPPPRAADHPRWSWSGSPIQAGEEERAMKTYLFRDSGRKMIYEGRVPS